LEFKGMTLKERSAELRDKYWEGVLNARENGKKIAIAGNPVPTDFLSAMNIEMIFPSNISATCSVRKVATELCEVAHTYGYPSYLCSYGQTHVGDILMGDETISPYGKLPRPDFIVGSTGQDWNIVKWYQNLKQIYDVPLFLIDVPFVHDDASPDFLASAKKYVKEQLKDLVRFLEEQTDKRFNYDRLQEATALTKRLHEVWRAILDKRRNIPSPFTFFDMIMDYLFPVRYMRGRTEGIEFLELALGEIIDRIEQKTAAVPGEKYRLHWNGVPIYFGIGSLSKKLSTHNAILLTGVYELVSHYENVNPSRPIDTMVDVMLGAYFGRGTKFKIDSLVKLVEDYSLDGILMQSSQTCKAYTIGLQDIAQAIKEKTGVSSLSFEGEACDEKLFNQDTVYSQIDTFIEILDKQDRK